jgi:hypothetical protein
MIFAVIVDVVDISLMLLLIILSTNMATCPSFNFILFGHLLNTISYLLIRLNLLRENN